MKVLLTMSMTFFVVVGTLRGESDYERYRRALRNNPVGIVDLTVIDDRGVCVKDVEGKAMYRTSRGEGWNDDQSYTDKNGHVLLKGRTNHDVNYSLEKEGYYTTTGWYDFTSSGTYDSVKKTFWGYEWVPPYNETVVLKMIRNPTPMYACHLLPAPLKIPFYEKEIPFDLRVMDWCKPYGQGIRDDIYIFVKRMKKDDRTSPRKVQLKLIFKHKDEGIYFGENDQNSGFWSTYEVDQTQKFQSTFTYDREKDGHNFQNKWHEHGVFRIRCEHDKSGRLISAHYGKIYGAWKVEKSGKDDILTDVVLYFNPTPNDINLEYDTKRNLYKSGTSAERNREDVLMP